MSIWFAKRSYIVSSDALSEMLLSVNGSSDSENKKKAILRVVRIVHKGWSKARADDVDHQNCWPSKSARVVGLVQNWTEIHT